MPGSSVVRNAVELLSAVEYQGDQLARFSFTGPFLQRQVSWHCELITLKQHARDTGQAQQQQFLEVIPTSEADEYDIRIGLMLDRIDQAAIHKTVIMVRQYRSLAVGVHYYGEVYSV